MSKYISNYNSIYLYMSFFPFYFLYILLNIKLYNIVMNINLENSSSEMDKYSLEFINKEFENKYLRKSILLSLTFNRYILYFTFLTYDLSFIFIQIIYEN
jgi:hypothetical protein